ncbi:MAG: alpha/beta fold hydrolase [Geminicoccaceae bacterium]
MDICRAQVEGPDGSYGLSYARWGAPDAARAIVCLHGLTRNGRDFDRLAEALAREAQVICPDMVGRGLSDPLADPEQYALPTYVAHMLQLLAGLGLNEVEWVGTSMGGLIGMGVAASGEASPIRRLVLNDIGPFIPSAGLRRINTYLGLDLRFASLDGLEAHLRAIHEGFGPLSDDQWRHLAERSAARREDGRFGLNYDQRLGEPLKREPIEDVDLWAVWDQIRCPVLVLRGRESDLLLPETAAEMARRGPKAKVVQIDGAGHAPALIAKDQIETVRDWLAN